MFRWNQQCKKTQKENPVADNIPVVFRKIRELDPIIPWEVFRDDPVLMHAHMVRVKNVGSLFGFTPEQRDEIRRILANV